MKTGLLIFCMIAGVLFQKVHGSNPANYVTQKIISGDVKSWLSPNDGDIATENTPIFGIKKKPKISKTEVAEYEVVEYQNVMKQVSEFLYKNYSFAIAPDSSERSNINEAPTSTTENSNTSASAQPEPKQDLNSQIRRILNKYFSDWNIIIWSRATTPKPALPYPTAVYPEILVIIDNALYKTLDSDMIRTVTHTLAFFNGVDLYYRNLENPKLRFNIAAILIVQEKDGFPALEFAPNKIEANSLIRSIGGWLYNHQDKFPLSSYDIAVTMTSNEITAKVGEKEFAIGGAALAGYACKVMNDLNRVVKFATVREKGDFSGIAPAAHELGHSFGIIKHDDQLDKGCPEGEGTMMSVSLIGRGSKAFKWSQCSLDMLTETFVNSKAECLYNKPKSGKPVPRLLAGQLFSDNQQCHFKRENDFAVNSENICKELLCRTKEDGSGSYEQTNWRAGAIDGTTCGQDKICLLGKCVQLNQQDK